MRRRSHPGCCRRTASVHKITTECLQRAPSPTTTNGAHFDGCASGSVPFSINSFIDRLAYIDKHTCDLGAMLILHDHRATTPSRVLTKGFCDVGRVGHGLRNT